MKSIQEEIKKLEVWGWALGNEYRADEDDKKRWMDEIIALFKTKWLEMIGEDEKHKVFECNGTPSYENFCEDTEHCPSQDAVDIRQRNFFRMSLRQQISKEELK